MVEFILFILICILWWYAVDTKRRLIRAGVLLDKVIAQMTNDISNLELSADATETNIELLEKQLARQSTKKHQVK